jgi:hypothetical protein
MASKTDQDGQMFEQVEDVELKSTVHNPRANLVPRPSEDEGDPLNWPMKLKVLILIQVCWLAFVSKALHKKGIKFSLIRK